MASFECIGFGNLNEEGKLLNKCSGTLKISIRSEFDKNHIDITNEEKFVETFPITKNIHTAKLGSSSMVMTVEDESYIFNFKTINESKAFEKQMKSVASQNEVSIFTQRTEASSAEQYFQFYGYMSQQQNMMQDYIRTSTYQRAMLDNIADFRDKVVLDVGAGSGILSFFAIQAGAKKVYAIEASSMAKHCQNLVKNNKLSSEIIVIAGKIEEVQLKEKVDVIISEPMGYMLFNERMLETFLHAKKWLKPGGKMYPTQGDLHVAPFTDETLYMEQCSKANFWYQNSFHSVDLSSLREAALLEYFRQPIVDTFDIRICLARSVKHTVNFETAHESDLHTISIPVSFNLLHSGTIHGLAFWFDVAFLGSQNAVWLSTAPTQPLTHWYQVRCLLQTPIFAKQGQTLVGKVLLKSNTRQSYDVDISLGIPGTSIKSCNTLDLKNPFFRYTGQPIMPPPGTNNASPSESYWNQQDINVQNSQYAAGGTMMNGGIGDGTHMNPQALYNNIGNIACGNPNNNHNNSSNNHHARTSIGGGISPVLFNQSMSAAGVMMGQQQQQHQQQQQQGNNNNLNHYMIGDYMVQPSNNFVPSNLGLLNFKGQ